MNNVKAFAIASDGTMKRIAITYDVINEEGKVVNSNVKINRIITDNDVLESTNTILNYAQSIVDNVE